MIAEPTDLQTAGEDEPRSAALQAVAAVMRARIAQQARADRPFAAPVNVSAAAGAHLGQVPGGGVQEPPVKDGVYAGPPTDSFIWRDVAASFPDVAKDLDERPIPAPRRPVANALAGFSTTQWTPLPAAPSTIPTVDTPPAERAARMAVAASLGRRQVQRAVVDVPAPEIRRDEIPEGSRQSPHRARRGLRAWRRRRPLAWFRGWAS